MADDSVTPTKIEPTLTVIEDAPPIAAAAPEAAPAEVAAKTEIKIDEPTKAEIKADEPAKAEVAAEPAKAEATTPEPAKFDAGTPPAKEPPVMPRAAQLAVEPVAATDIPIWRRPIRARDAKPAQAAAQPRGSRFTLLAASVAIAASLGAVAGSFGAAKFGTPPEVSSAAHVSNTTEDIKALKEQVAQLRATTKTLSDNFGGLKLSVSNTNAQLTKMAEMLERIDKQADQRRAAATQASPEVTGSITPKPVPMVLGTPPSTLQHPIVQGWILRRVYDGTALIDGRAGIIEVEPGTMLPGIGRVEDIKKQDGRWVVLTSKGLIVSASK